MNQAKQQVARWIRAHQASKRIFLSNGAQSITFQEFCSAVEKRTQYLQSLLPYPAIVAFRGTSDFTFLVNLLAVWLHGSGFVPVEESLPEVEQQRILFASRATLLLTPQSAPIHLQKKPSTKIPALTLFTSGSSGTPKRVPLEWKQIWTTIRAAAKAQKISSRSKILVSLSFFHSGGLFIQTLPGIFSAASLRLCKPGASLKQALITDNGFSTHTILVPPQVELLRHQGDWEKISLSSFQCIVTGSADITRAAEFLLAKQARVMNVYGLTETCSFNVWSWVKQLRAPIPAGKTIRGISAKLSSKGEIILRGSVTYKGKSFCTGDLGSIHKGVLTVHGRANQKIKVGALPVFPAEIEHVILDVPGVLECKVITRKNFLLGEIPVATIVHDGRTDLALLRKKVRQQCHHVLGRSRSPLKFLFQTKALLRGGHYKVRSA